MGVLLATGTWPSLTELWLKRQIEGIAEHVVAFAAYEPTAAFYGDSIPAIRLAKPPRTLWRRALSRLGLRALADDYTSSERFAAAIADQRVSCVLVHYFDFAVRFRSVLMNCGKPVFVHCHGYGTKWDLRFHDRPDEYVHPPGYVQAALELSQHVTMIVNSQHSKGRLLEIGIPEDRIVVKYYGVPAPATPPPPHANRQHVEILYLGRLCDYKGADLTIQAFEIACQHGLRGRLTIAGDGELMMTCQLLWRRSPYRDRIRLLGAVNAEQGQQLRNEADIFTAHNYVGRLTGEDEALGVSIVEAMADGIPVVTGRQGGVCETVVDGETGMLFLPEDVEAHAEALMCLAGDPKLRSRMGRAGWERVRTEFSVAREQAALRKLLGIERQASHAKASSTQVYHGESATARA